MRSIINFIVTFSIATIISPAVVASLFYLLNYMQAGKIPMGYLEYVAEYYLMMLSFPFSFS